jgi:hypothetical protein
VHAIGGVHDKRMSVQRLANTCENKRSNDLEVRRRAEVRTEVGVKFSFDNVGEARIENRVHSTEVERLTDDI